MNNDIIFLLGIALVVFVIHVLLNSAFLWIASKLLKLKKQDYKTAVSTVLAYTAVMCLLVVASYVPYLIGVPLLSLILMLLVSLIGILLYIYLIKRFYDADWKNAALAFVIVFAANVVIGGILYFGLMVFGVALWQLGIFNAGQTGQVVTGFVKMQPLIPAIAYSGSTFTAMFTNALGTTITITNVSVKDAISGTDCSVEPLNEQVVRAGNAFTVQGDCGQKNEGETYDLIVTITYNTTIGGVPSTHTDTGHISGQAETGYTSDVIPPEDLSKGVNGANYPTTTTGFERLQPLAPTIYYESNGSYEIALDNAAGVVMNITSVSIGTSDGQNCQGITVNGKDFSTGGNLRLRSGEVITITASCPPKKTGDPYDVSLSIDYSAAMGGIVTTNKESGEITGGVEF